MRQHIFYFTVFIVIFGLVSIGTVDAATMTENFDGDPGWTSSNLPVNNNYFGFRDSNFAGGDPGEAGGFFSRSDQVAWYGNDNIGNFTGNDVLSASGLMNIRDVGSGYDNNIHIGHFDSNGPPQINGIGFQILEYPTNNQAGYQFRIFYEIGDTEGELFIIGDISKSRTWSYVYDPIDGTHGSLTVSISGLGGDTVKVFLSETQRDSIGALDTFGLAVGALGSASQQLEFYIDNVSYTSDVFNEPPEADAGSDKILDADSACFATDTLDGSNSTDPNSSPTTNDDIVAFDWYEGVTYLVSGETLDYTFSLGVHTITLVVTDTAGETDEDEVIITVEDNTPPQVTAELVEIGMLNQEDAGKFRVQYGCSDNCDTDLTPTAAIECSVSSGEEFTWRSGKGFGHLDVTTFDLVVTCEDSSGNIGTAIDTP